MVPADLPPGVLHVPYAPFSDLLPRCAAIVHHGGIGTTAQSLAAGARQIVMPFAHDQLDNADRVVKLGCGRWIEPKQYKAKYVATVLKKLPADEPAARACAEMKSRLIKRDGVDRACDLIESLSRPQNAAIAQ
jgi:UDP:flavonoid glycosyltransferase YjiC (YdhE family)